jgi:hypothetical protein
MQVTWSGYLSGKDDSAATVCEKTFITCTGMIVPALNVPMVDVFGTGIFHKHTVPLNRYQLHSLLLPFIFSFPHFLSPFNRTGQ